MTTAIIHFDGGTRPTNPGPSAIGYVFEADGETVEQSNHIGKATNNEAEYHALIQALKTARQSGYDVVEVYGDSQLVVKQVRGEWSVNEQHLRTLRDRARELAEEFESFKIRHIPREGNKEADALVEQEAKESFNLM